MPFANRETEALRRLIGTNSDRVALDKVGRICLPEEMLREAAIEKEAMLVGLVDRFQIWNPERYAATRALDEQLADKAYELI